MNNLTFAPVAWDEYLYWQTQDKKTLRRINQLLKDIQRSSSNTNSQSSYSQIKQ